MSQKQSEYTLTQGASRPLLSDGRSASTKAAQPIAQSANRQKTNTDTSTRYSPKPSTGTSKTETDEKVLAELFNDLKIRFRVNGLLTVKRIPSTGEMVLVISQQLEHLMRQPDEI